jgi:hypothetical protein
MSVSSLSDSRNSSGKIFMTFVFNNAKISIYEMPVINLNKPVIKMFKLVKSSALNRF